MGNGEKTEGKKGRQGEKDSASHYRYRDAVQKIGTGYYSSVNWTRSSL
jgi:hypothetical protein